ncbi:sperm-associated antigen 17 isoform X4 [Triplophysa dalaica]|uniref:sperm-associated antigen 17 isoform X4 n=1 Tax=Triplophysa dalaica TaxID=1582913 RepID=UPI0024E00454|nr:sperm-associated antigen 17 isoform X4 [Triplophysa dalaica]
MPPKRIASVTPSGVTPARAASGKHWDSSLSAAVFEENDWRVSVSLVQTEKAEDEQLSSALIQAVQKPLRKLFSVLSWQNTLEKINELGNPKSRKTKDVPMFYEVTEVAKSQMDAGEKITVDLMAKLIKFHLLILKNNDIQRRAAERKALEDNAHVKGEANYASKDQGGKGAVKGKNDLSVSTKNTKLKRRGEEENNIEYIDDEPDDGPQHYILMMGFYQPHLISALNSLGVHVSNVIKLGLEKEDKLEAFEETKAEENHNSPEDQEVDFLKQKRQQELDVFWKQLDQVLNSGSKGSRLFDAAILKYNVKGHLLPEDTGNAEAMMAFGEAMFEGVACLVYDSLDWRRQHNHYLNSMNLIQVPVASGPSQHLRPHSSIEVIQTPRRKAATEENSAEPESPVLSTEVDMRYYCDLLDRIAPEITSVPLILHCMLEQLVASEQKVMSGSVESMQNSDETDKDLIHYMVSSVMSLPMQEEDRKKLMEDFGIQDTPTNLDQKHPLLINHHDERSRRLHQFSALDGFNPIKIEADIMKQSLVWTGLVSRFPESSSDRLSRSQELWHFCTDESMSWSEVQRLLQLFVFESMRLTTVDESGSLKGPDPATPTSWDNPVEYSKHLYWNNRCTPGPDQISAGTQQQKANKVTITDLQKTLIRQLGHWNFVENHIACVFPQVIQSASETYRCLDKFHSCRDNAIYVFCHHPMSPHRSCKEFWNTSLHTDVGFRYYLEYVADSINEWTRQEEEKWHLEQERKEKERTLIQTPPESDLKRDSPVKAPIVDTEIYIRKDSLKAWKMEQDRLNEEEESKKSSKEKGGKATPKVKEEMKTPVSSRKSREIVSKTPSSATLTGDKTGDVPESPQGPPDTRKANAFTGYNLNGKLVQVCGEVQSFYPSDGGQIDMESFHFKQGLKQLKICVKKDGHHFYTHISERKKEHDELKDIDTIKQDIVSANPTALGGKADCETEKCGFFYAVLANGIQLSCSHTSPNKIKAETHNPIVPCSCTDQQQGEAPETHHEHMDNSSAAFLKLHVSVPNGLILYFDFEDLADGHSSSCSLVIKQRYYNTGSRSYMNMQREVSRVITCRGTIIKHMKDGSTEVLFADGTVSRSPDSEPVCVLVPQTPAEDQESIKELAVDTKGVKNKKGKGNSTVNAGDDMTQSKTVEKEKPYSFEVTGGTWTTTTPSGLRVASVAGKEIVAQPLLTYHATDPFNETVVVTREDKVQSVLRKDGTLIVDHADGTRITTFNQQSELQQHLISGEKLVRVEKTEFATVIMDCEGKGCEVLLGDGTSISTTGHGSYKVYPCGGGVLHIDKDGGAVYTSHPSGTDTDQFGQYLMNHRADVLCHVIDPDGNRFEVNADGQIAVSRSKQPKNEETEIELQQNAAFKTHPPRLFVVHEDGSASELLRAQDVDDVLQKAYSDSSIAVLTDPLPESLESCCITLLRPCPEDSHWLLSKHEDDIIPTNLKSRKWDSFPSSEKTTPGLPFGTTLGCGLEIKNKPKCTSIQAQPVLECPDVLLVRQVIQHPPVTEPLRRKLMENIKVYLEQLLERENQLEMIQPKDPRCAQMLCLPKAEDPQVAMEPLSGDVASLYTETVSAGQQSNNLQEKTNEKHTKSVDKRKQDSLRENRINRHRQELQEERRHRIALRHEIVTPYFHPELQEMNSFFTHEDQDLNSLSKHLPPFPPKRNSRAPGISMDSSSVHLQRSFEN